MPARGTTRPWRSPVCTGTSSIWCGYSSSRSFISGRVRRRGGHMETAAGHGPAEGQQHPIAVYLWIWALLFVFSTFSYLVDYFHFHGILRWSLIITFMLVKAGLIVAIFMHMAWERLALK